VSDQEETQNLQSRRAFLQLGSSVALGLLALPAIAQQDAGNGNSIGAASPSSLPPDLIAGGGVGGSGGGQGRGPGFGPGPDYGSGPGPQNRPNDAGGGNGTPPGLGDVIRQRHFDRTVMTPAVLANNAFSVILGRPTNKSIVVSILSADAQEGYVEYGVKPGVYTKKTSLVQFPVSTPVEIKLDGLQPNTAYYYRVRSRAIGESDFAEGASNRFHTQRAKGSTFTFAMQGDSHPERPNQHLPLLYAQTLTAAAQETHDLYFTSGDDFSVTSRIGPVTADTVRNLYLYQRAFLPIVAASAPVFLGNGNWDYAAQANLDGTPDNVSVLAQNARNSLFPQPSPDGFYSGDKVPVQFIGLLRDYYEFTWGDAHFIYIDPYWHSPLTVDTAFQGKVRTTDVWNSTLGDVQYQWLKKTLSESTSKYKILITHHVLGTGRGGVEDAKFGEWGGHDREGNYQFETYRPDWDEPIHRLLVKHGVDVVFQGHDHVFARGELDGVVYQTLPQPADPNYVLYFADVYKNDDKRPNTGYVRVTVDPKNITVDYIRQYLPEASPDPQLVQFAKDNGADDGFASPVSGQLAFSYKIPAKVRTLA